MFSDPLAMREPGVGIPFLGTLGSRALASQLLGLLSSGCLDLPENLQLRFVTLEVARACSSRAIGHFLAIIDVIPLPVYCVRLVHSAPFLSGR